MNKLFPILILTFQVAFLSAQSNFLKLINKEDFDKVEKKLLKAMEKEPNDVGNNFSMGLLLIQRNYNNYNPKSAYGYFLNSESFYKNLSDEKELKKLSEIPINSEVILNYLDTTCLKALEDAITENKLETYESYLSYFKRASNIYVNRSVDKRNIVAFGLSEQKNTVEGFQFFIDTYSKAIQVPEAIKKRDRLAFEIAKKDNTVEGFQFFIDKYPQAIDKEEAILLRNALAYARAEKQNSIEAFKGFIDSYPKAKEVNIAWQKIYFLDFEISKKENTAERYYKHMREYPKSNFYEEARNKSYVCEFNENVTIGDLNSYYDFIRKYNNNPKKSIAIDSLYPFFEKKLLFSGMEFCIENADEEQRIRLLLKYHDIYTIDGETTTLDKFYSKYKDSFLKDIKRKDYEIAEKGKKLYLGYGYSESYFDQYDEFIKIAAPKHRAFVALQKMIKSNLDEKRFDLALNTVKGYSEFFKNDKHFNNLITLLESPVDKTIKIEEIKAVNNSEKGSQYVPVLTADEKILYFCGIEREDNIGGEDIFYSNKLSNGNWSTPKILENLSTDYSHEAMEHVNADNTSLYFFSGGTIKNCELTQEGITTPYKLSPNINQGLWQADLSLSSDGNVMIFSSVYEDNLNYNIKSSREMIDGLEDYHGNGGSQSDIYVSLKDEYGNWGKAKNLGNVINTIHIDRSAFLHPDMKTLYFSSDGHGGLGGIDVFVSKRLADSCWDCWSEPVNLGKDINSSNSDWGYKINTSGDKAFFSKNNKIHYLYLPKHLRPNFVATVNGTVTNDKGEIIPCNIKWEDLETGKIIGSSKTNPKDGSYFMVLPLGKNYGYYIEKEGYFPLSNNLNVKNINKPTTLTENITLLSFKKMIEESASVRINNLFFNTGESVLLPASIPELKRVAEIIKKNNLKIEIQGHTDNVGDDSSNKTLSEQRANAVRDFLKGEGISLDLLKTIGFGESKPITSNDTEAGKAKNRRVEIRFIK